MLGTTVNIMKVEKTSLMLERLLSQSRCRVSTIVISKISYSQVAKKRVHVKLCCFFHH